MTKTKFKIIAFIFLAIAGLIAGFFFSGLVNLALSRNFNDASQLVPSVILKSLAENKNHRMLLLCTELLFVSGIALIFLMNKRETFESEVSNIAGGLNTPITVGQEQHGTSRWLKKTEQPKVFAHYWLDTSDKTLEGLHNAGLRDRKDVKDYADKQNQTVGTATHDATEAAKEITDSKRDAPIAERVAEKIG